MRPDRRLTPREIEVLRLVAAGATNDAIARQLGRVARTVEFHLANARAKLHANSRTQAVVAALRLGYHLYD
jgi:DNA-binding CsgD family transcriptional regulator